jgi:hypothetical protein
MAAPCGFDWFHRQGSQVQEESCIYRFWKYSSVGSEGYDTYRYRCHRTERRTCHSFQGLVRQIVEEHSRSNRTRGAATPGDLSNLFRSSRLAVQTNRCSVSPWWGRNDWCQSPRCVIPAPHTLVTKICRQREFRQLSSLSSVTSSSGLIEWKLSALALVFAS